MTMPPTRTPLLADYAAKAATAIAMAGDPREDANERWVHAAAASGLALIAVSRSLERIAASMERGERARPVEPSAVGAPAFPRPFIVHPGKDPDPMTQPNAPQPGDEPRFAVTTFHAPPNEQSTGTTDASGIETAEQLLARIIHHAPGLVLRLGDAIAALIEHPDPLEVQHSLRHAVEDLADAPAAPDAAQPPLEPLPPASSSAAPDPHPLETSQPSGTLPDGSSATEDSGPLPDPAATDASVTGADPETASAT